MHRGPSKRPALRGERGQMLIIFALVIAPVTFAVGAVAVDASLWQSERRGAQKDADFAALAGGYELLAATNDPTPAAAAAAAYQEFNDEAGNASIIDTVHVDNSCFNSDVLDSVTVNVSHASRTFFGEAFGLSIAPDIGAHARVCMGSPIEGEGLFPLGVQVSSVDMPDSNCFEPDPDDPTGPEIPIFGQYCQLAFAGAGLTSGEGGFLDMYNDGTDRCSNQSTGGLNVLNDIIVQGGANTTCWVAPAGTTPDDCDGPPPSYWPTPYVNYCVFPKTGTFTNPTQGAFTDLLDTEGECDTKFGQDGNLHDDWLEVVEALNGDPAPDPGTTTFAKRDCKSPRLVNLVIIESFEANGNDPKPILAFASFYIHSCLNPDGVEFRDCNVSGGQIGQTKLNGFFMNILNLGSLGAVNKYGQRHIALWE